MGASRQAKAAREEAAQVAALAREHDLLAEWLASGDSKILAEALMVGPNVAPADALAAFARALSAAMK